MIFMRSRLVPGPLTGAMTAIMTWDRVPMRPVSTGMTIPVSEPEQRPGTEQQPAH